MSREGLWRWRLCFLKVIWFILAAAAPSKGTPQVTCDISQLCSNKSAYYWMSLSVKPNKDSITEQQLENLVSAAFHCNGSSNNFFIELCTVGKLQVEEVSCRPNITATESHRSCNVVLLLQHPVSVCELQRAAEAALQDHGGPLQANITGNVERVGRNICKDAFHSSGGFVRCTSTSPLDEICQSSMTTNVTCSVLDMNFKAVPEETTNSCNRRHFCNCSTVCKTESQLYAFKINITSNNITINLLKNLLLISNVNSLCQSNSQCKEFRDIIPNYKRTHLECYGENKQRFYSCMVVLEMSKSINGCSLSKLVQLIIEKDKFITTDSSLSQMVVCGGASALSGPTLLASNLTWNKLDLKISDVCQPDPLLLECEANQTLAVLLADSCPPEPQTKSTTQPNTQTNSLTSPTSVTHIYISNSEQKQMTWSQNPSLIPPNNLTIHSITKAKNATVNAIMSTNDKKVFPTASVSTSSETKDFNLSTVRPLGVLTCNKTQINDTNTIRPFTIPLVVFNITAAGAFEYSKAKNDSVTTVRHSSNDIFPYKITTPNILTVRETKKDNVTTENNQSTKTNIVATTSNANPPTYTNTQHVTAHGSIYTKLQNVTKEVNNLLANVLSYKTPSTTLTISQTTAVSAMTHDKAQMSENYAATSNTNYPFYKETTPHNRHITTYNGTTVTNNVSRHSAPTSSNNDKTVKQAAIHTYTHTNIYNTTTHSNKYVKVYNTTAPNHNHTTLSYISTTSYNATNHNNTKTTFYNDTTPSNNHTTPYKATALTDNHTLVYNPTAPSNNNRTLADNTKPSNNEPTLYSTKTSRNYNTTVFNAITNSDNHTTVYNDTNHNNIQATIHNSTTLSNSHITPNKAATLTDNHTSVYHKTTTPSNDKTLSNTITTPQKHATVYNATTQNNILTKIHNATIPTNNFSSVSNAATPSYQTVQQKTKNNTTTPSSRYTAEHNFTSRNNHTFYSATKASITLTTVHKPLTSSNNPPSGQNITTITNNTVSHNFTTISNTVLLNNNSTTNNVVAVNNTTTLDGSNTFYTTRSFINYTTLTKSVQHATGEVNITIAPTIELKENTTTVNKNTTYAAAATEVSITTRRNSTKESSTSVTDSTKPSNNEKALYNTTIPSNYNTTVFNAITPSDNHATIHNATTRNIKTTIHNFTTTSNNHTTPDNATTPSNNHATPYKATAITDNHTLVYHTTTPSNNNTLYNTITRSNNHATFYNASTQNNILTTAATEVSRTSHSNPITENRTSAADSIKPTEAAFINSTDHQTTVSVTHMTTVYKNDSRLTTPVNTVQGTNPTAPNISPVTAATAATATIAHDLTNKTAAIAKVSSTTETTTLLLTKTTVSAVISTGTTLTTKLKPNTTTNSMEELLKKKRNETQDVSNLNSSEVSTLVAFIEKFVDGPSVSQSEGKILIDIVTNLINADPEVISGSTNRLIKIVDTLGLKLAVTGDRGILSSPSLVLEVRTVDGTNFSETSVDFFYTDKIELRNVNGSLFKMPASTLASVDLPSSLTAGLSPEEKQQASRVQFTFYKDNSLFKDSTLDNQTAVSAVLGSSVANLSITNLKENITIKIANKNLTQHYIPSCVFWNFTKQNNTGGWDDIGCSVINATHEYTTCSCNHLTSFAVLLDLSRSGVTDSKQAMILTYITYIGCGVSAVFLAFTLITYILFEKLLRDIPAKILVHLCLSLLLLNLVFLVDGWLASSENVNLCISTAFFLHYFLLTSFTWAGLEALHMYLSIVRVFTPYLSKYMLKFALMGWGIPLVVVVITVAVDHNNYGLVQYGKNENFCWLRNDIAFYVAVVAYFLLIFASCLVVFIVVIVQLSRIKKQNPHNQSHNRSAMTDVRSIIGLVVLLGLTWGFALFPWGEARLTFIYLFTIFNSMLGLFVFIFHCAVKDKVRRMWRTFLCCGNMRLPENSEWSQTATHNNRKMSVARCTNSAKQYSNRNSPVVTNHSNSSTSVDVDSGISKSSNSDVILNEIHKRSHFQQGEP